MWGAQLVWRASIASDTTHRPTPCCSPPLLVMHAADRRAPQPLLVGSPISSVEVSSFKSSRNPRREREDISVLRDSDQNECTPPFTTARGAVRGNIRSAHRPEQ